MFTWFCSSDVLNMKVMFHIPKAQLVKQQAERAMKKAQEEAERREREEEERKKQQEDEEKRRLQELEVGAETTIGDSKEEQMSAENTVCCGVHHRLTLLQVRTRTHTQSHSTTNHIFSFSLLLFVFFVFFFLNLTDLHAFHSAKESKRFVYAAHSCLLACFLPSPLVVSVLLSLVNGPFSWPPPTFLLGSRLLWLLLSSSVLTL